MDILKKHEIFEMEVLKNLKNKKLLNPLVFGGGTMLRLCYGLNRYSSDLDFYFIKRVNIQDYFNKMKIILEELYDVTDAYIKFNTVLFEIRSPNAPKRLKIEIRKTENSFDYQERIAFSKNSTIQVILKVLTLEQMMKNKIKAALNRKSIRDCFDLEFLLRQGIAFESKRKELEELEKVISNFKDRDFKVSLGSILDTKTRHFYNTNRFSYLLIKIKEVLNT